MPSRIALGLMAAQLAHFHHLHLNSTDPKAALDFYHARLEAEKRIFFTKVDAPPQSEITSAIWHMGWGGGENMKETYQHQLDLPTKFQTPLTDISDQCDGKGGNGRFLFAYIDAPDHALIELNTTAAGKPVAAGEWYVKEFGLQLRGQTQTRYRCGRQTGPAVSLMMDDVSVIIYPVGNAKAAFPDAWKGREDLEPSQGHAIDHLGFRVDDLKATLARLRKDGVTVTEEHSRSAFIEGPDHIRIEVLEDRTTGGQ
jgi:catechol 2,3-dioxygenase-like lactoylglutathione lyase family enzyme